MHSLTQLLSEKYTAPRTFARTGIQTSHLAQLLTSSRCFITFSIGDLDLLFKVTCGHLRVLFMDGHFSCSIYLLSLIYRLMSSDASQQELLWYQSSMTLTHFSWSWAVILDFHHWELPPVSHQWVNAIISLVVIHNKHVDSLQASRQHFNTVVLWSLVNHTC